MANISGPDFITLLVSDLKTSYSFYKEKIGLRESAEKRPNAHAFQTKPCGLAIGSSENRKSGPRSHPLVAHHGRNCLTS
jgi:hypothetical protein